jgi:hypothetical protein
VLSAAALVGELTTGAVGYVGLCALAAAMYAAVGLVVTVRHAVEAARWVGVSRAVAVRATVRVPLAVTLAGVLPVLVAVAGYPGYVLHWLS